MDDLERLRAERDKLEREDLRKEIFNRDVANQNRERRNLKKEIWARKNKKTVKVINVAKRSTVGVGMILGKVGKTLGRGAVTMAQNYEMNNQPERPRSPTRKKRKSSQKIVYVMAQPKRKVVKRKSPKKRRVVKKVVRRNDLPNFNNFFN